MKTVLVTLVFFGHSLQSFAVSHTKLGERPSYCKKLDGDDFELTIAKDLVPEAFKMFEYDKLTKVITSNPDCFRVGTEIRLNLEGKVIGYLGKALINRMDIISSQQLKNLSLPYSKNTIEDYVKENPAKKYGVFSIKVYEKIEEVTVTTQFERLPTCFSTYVDWEGYRVPAEDGMKVVKKITGRKKRAHIWNGTFNCYKIGTKARIYLMEDPAPKDYGSVIPTELAVVHYTNLTQRHAKILGENLSSLKKRMAKGKDIDGGYTTMVVFDYIKPGVAKKLNIE